MHRWCLHGADQLLPQLLIQQFDTLPSQCRHIEHVHEGAWFHFFSDKMTAMRTKTIYLYKLIYIELSVVNNFVYLILTNVPDCKFKDHLQRFL